MAITGTGTQADPYIVDTWADFVSAFNENNKYITFPDDTVFDFNEIQNYASQLTGTQNIIDGNDVCFENITMDSGVFISSTYKNSFSNINFKNIYFSGNANFISSRSNNSWCYFINCKFSGILQGESVFNNSGDKVYFGTNINSVGCGINLRIAEQAKFMDSGYYCYCYNCQFVINCNSSATDGTIRVINSILQGAIGGASRTLYATNCIVDAEITTALTNSHSASVSVLNSDKIGVDGTNSGFIAVTTAQLKDESYLQSINFPIGA